MVAGLGQEHVVLNLASIPGAVPAASLESSRASEERTGGRPQASEKSPPWGPGKIAGATLIGTGVVAIAGGATLLLFDKKQSCSLPSGENQCDRRTNTRVPGWSLIGGGAIATVVGVWVFRSSSSEVSVAMGPSSFAISGRF
jgi:hypothetical protein